MRLATYKYGSRKGQYFIQCLSYGSVFELVGHVFRISIGQGLAVLVFKPHLICQGKDELLLSHSVYYRLDYRLSDGCCGEGNPVSMYLPSFQVMAARYHDIRKLR